MTLPLANWGLPQTHINSGKRMTDTASHVHQEMHVHREIEMDEDVQENRVYDCPDCVAVQALITELVGALGEIDALGEAACNCPTKAWQHDGECALGVARTALSHARGME